MTYSFSCLSFSIFVCSSKLRQYVTTWTKNFESSLFSFYKSNAKNYDTYLIGSLHNPFLPTKYIYLRITPEGGIGEQKSNLLDCGDYWTIRTFLHVSRILHCATHTSVHSMINNLHTIKLQLRDRPSNIVLKGTYAHEHVLITELRNLAAFCPYQFPLRTFHMWQNISI